MSILGRIYDLSLRGARSLSPFFAGGSGKVGEGLRGRARDRYLFREWAQAERDPARPLVWFHAPSVGEGLQARAILEAMKEVSPGVQLAYSFFSPSAERLARKLAVDVAGYLPWDLQVEVSPTLDALRPDAIVFTKTEVWPGLTSAATRREIPVFLAAATLPPNAGRLRWPARRLLRQTFGALEGVLAISDDDGHRFRQLGVPEARIQVTGDPAMDSVMERVEATDPDAAHLVPLSDGRLTVLAGSTWEPDEAVLIPALTALRHRIGRLVIAPHEPTPAHLEPLEVRLADAGWTTTRLRPEIPPEADAVIVDRVGILAELYTIADLAFVGGGFHSAGLHSVLEPAAAGVPVLFGPGHENARAAGELMAVGGGREVADASELQAALERWLDDDARRHAGDAARHHVESHRGAAERTARILSELLP